MDKAIPALIDTITALQVELTAHKVDLQNAFAVVDKSNVIAKRTHRRSLITMIVAMLSMAMVIAAVVLGYQAERHIDSFEDVRLHARKITCDEHNTMLDTIEIVVVSASAAAILALADDPTSLTPEQQVRYDRYVASLTETTSSALAPIRRDCSEQGIDDFYSSETS